MNKLQNHPEANYKPFEIPVPEHLPHGANPSQLRKAALVGEHAEFGKSTTVKGREIGHIAAEAYQHDRDFANAETDEE